MVKLILILLNVVILIGSCTKEQLKPTLIIKSNTYIKITDKRFNINTSYLFNGSKTIYDITPVYIEFTSKKDTLILETVLDERMTYYIICINDEFDLKTQ